MSLSLACMKRVMLAWSGADTEDNKGSGTSALLVAGCKDRVSMYQYVIGIGPISVEADILAFTDQSHGLNFQWYAVGCLMDAPMNKFTVRSKVTAVVKDEDKAADLFLVKLT